MDELIGRLVAGIGVDRATAEKALGVIFDFLVKEGPADKVRPLLAMLPGSEALMQKFAADSGGITGGADGGGVMGAGMRMMAVGLSMEQTQSMAREVFAYAREKAGDVAVGEAVAAIPGLSQLV